jgi:hypothetical protein
MDAAAKACLSGPGPNSGQISGGVEAGNVTAGTEFRTKAILGLWRYRRGAAAFIANRTRMPFVQCRDIIEWNWHILIEAYDEGARFQEAGRRIMAAGQLTPGRLRTG